jgi:hypothetical protein
MNHRAVVNVATGPYVKGQERLLEECARQGVDYVHWRDRLPDNSPAHKDTPYAFKAHAMKQAAIRGYSTLLWADACILPIRPLSEVFDLIERDGYWMARNGFTNYEWTADSAYPDLFSEIDWAHTILETACAQARALNRKIEHVVATTFGVDTQRAVGAEFLFEYLRLANTNAFRGPWKNDAAKSPCGPPDVRGHRHDQTAASVIAWRLGFKFTSAPHVFAYKGTEPGWMPDPATILLADGGY